MRGVAAGHGDGPMPRDLFMAGQLAPGLAVVPLVPVFVDHDGLAVALTGDRRAPVGFGAAVLDDRVVDPRLMGVVPGGDVVDADRMSVGIAGAHVLAELVPVPGPQQFVLVRHGPPDVPVGRKPGCHIAYPGLVVGLVHLGEAPVIIGVEEDDVGLDALGPQLLDPPFDVGEELRIEAIEVEAAVRLADIGKLRRIDAIELVPLGEEAEADLGEAALAERGHRLVLLRCVAVQPVVGGGAEEEVGRPVGIGEMIGFRDVHGSVDPGSRGGHDEATGDAVQRGVV